MLAQLKRASRSCIAFIWAMAVVFAVAPAVSMAYASPVGAFSRPAVHAHEHGDDDHVHHSIHLHLAYVHPDDADHRHHKSSGDEPQDDEGQPGLHVHHEACCPSVLVPVVTASTVHIRVTDRVTLPRVEPLQGAPRNRLLRPPIPSSLF
ncbi:MAG: hypothetical protein F9K29_10740 [Hyphomicrobiaceae bacterium]|nr:MAG: hypothetical protein F9K29_10740 [Hyphomicrobiaceae bacterium]